MSEQQSGRRTNFHLSRDDTFTAKAELYQEDDSNYIVIVIVFKTDYDSKEKKVFDIVGGLTIEDCIKQYRKRHEDFFEISQVIAVGPTVPVNKYTLIKTLKKNVFG